MIYLDDSIIPVCQLLSLEVEHFVRAFIRFLLHFKFNTGEMKRHLQNCPTRGPPQERMNFIKLKNWKK